MGDSLSDMVKRCKQYSDNFQMCMKLSRLHPEALDFLTTQQAQLRLEIEALKTQLDALEVNEKRVMWTHDMMKAFCATNYEKNIDAVVKIGPLVKELTDHCAKGSAVFDDSFILEKLHNIANELDLGKRGQTLEQRIGQLQVELPNNFSLHLWGLTMETQILSNKRPRLHVEAVPPSSQPQPQPQSQPQQVFRPSFFHPSGHTHHLPPYGQGKRSAYSSKPAIPSPLTSPMGSDKGFDFNSSPSFSHPASAVPLVQSPSRNPHPELANETPATLLVLSANCSPEPEPEVMEPEPEKVEVFKWNLYTSMLPEPLKVEIHRSIPRRRYVKQSDFAAQLSLYKHSELPIATRFLETDKAEYARLMKYRRSVTYFGSQIIALSKQKILSSDQSNIYMYLFRQDDRVWDGYALDMEHKLVLVCHLEEGAKWELRNMEDGTLCTDRTLTKSTIQFVEDDKHPLGFQYDLV